MNEIKFTIISFVLILIIRLLVYKKNKSKVPSELLYLKNKYKLDIDKMNNIKIMGVISFLDSFIINISLILCTMLAKNIFIELIIGLVLLIILILILYKIFSIILLKKGFGE